MAKKKTTRVKVDAAEVAIPQSRNEVCEAIADIGRAQRERDRIQAGMNDDLATVRKRYEEAAAPHAARISALTQGVAAWCEANRFVLTKNGKTKTAKLSTGEISWRTRPPSVTLRGKPAIIEALEKLGLKRFLRIRADVDKDAILRDPDAVEGVKGISISQREDFVIKPDSTELEEVQ